MTLLPRQCRRLKRPHKRECAPDVYNKESECWSVNLGRHTYIQRHDSNDIHWHQVDNCQMIILNMHTSIICIYFNAGIQVHVNCFKL